MLNGKGTLTGEYWHPGHLAHADLNRDGKELLLAGGMNNAYQSATLVVFDPANVRGAARETDASAPELGLRDFPPGTELRVVLFPRTCIARLKPYNRVSSASFTGLITN